MKKLHLGCGAHLLSNYVNVDKCIDLEGVIKHDVLDLYFIEDDSVDEVVAFYLLEHLNYNEVSNLLYQISRVLIVSGILKILVPDFEEIANLYTSNKTNVEILDLINIELYICGEETGHKTIWNKALIEYHLTREGFFKIVKAKYQVGSKNLGIYVEAARTNQNKYYNQLLGKEVEQAEI